MPLPQLNAQQVSEAVPSATNVQFLANGGQKVVFSCLLEGQPHVLKFLLLGPAKPAGAETDPSLSADPVGPTFARAEREVETMSQCNCPTLVRLGPLGMTRVEIAGQDLLYFSEQAVDGSNLAALGKAGVALPIDELFDLAEDVTEAIKAIWAFAKIHRDIKPGNIMRRNADSRFVVLDVGLVLDLDDESLSGAGVLVGTVGYYSPEQLDLQQKRQLDFRSDLFALGIVLYQMATRVHPFIAPGSSAHHVLANIATQKAAPPSQLRPEIPSELEEIIMRLLAKRPHLRYRTCDLLLDAVKAGRDAYKSRTGGVK